MRKSHRRRIRPSLHYTRPDRSIKPARFAVVTGKTLGARMRFTSGALHAARERCTVPVTTTNARDEIARERRLLLSQRRLSLTSIAKSMGICQERFRGLRLADPLSA